MLHRCQTSKRKNLGRAGFVKFHSSHDVVGGKVNDAREPRDSDFTGVAATCGPPTAAEVTSDSESGCRYNFFTAMRTRMRIDCE